MIVIVPNVLRDAINAKLDAALAELPEEDRAVAEKDREFLYGQLLDAFDQYGTIPDFTLAPNLPEFRLVR
jgi:hypothetical protein